MENVFDVRELELKIKDLEMMSLKADFWDDQGKARSVLQEKTKYEEKLSNWKKFVNQIDDIENLREIALQEKDEQVLADLSDELEALNSSVQQEELKMMLSSEQ
ncbi:MAG: PCRF domain-containing protein, partial [Smithellaceae bacterium]